MGDLTRNFSRREFACRCGCGFDAIDHRLVTLLQSARDILGSPIVINSGCRCPRHNLRSDGSPTSQHVSGRAADVRAPGVPLRHLYGILDQAAPDGGVGVYPYDGFVHIDTRGRYARWGWLPHVGQVAVWEALARIPQ